MSAKVKINGVVEEVGSRTSKSGYTTHFVVVNDAPANAKYPNPVEIESKEEIGSVKAGDEVEAEFFVNGRAWTNPQGEKRYFNSLKLASLIVTKKAGPAHLASDYEATSKGALQAFLDAGKGDAKAFGPYCREIVGKASSKEYTAEDWQTVIGTLWPAKVEDAPADDGEFSDDIPW